LTSGFVYCIVNKMPFQGYSINEERELVMSHIDLNTFTGQFTFEAWAIAATTLLLVVSVICVFLLVGGGPFGTCLTWLLRAVALTAPAWLYLIIAFFREKHHCYSPGFRAAWATIPRKYSGGRPP
jgi:hypothetical protein